MANSHKLVAAADAHAPATHASSHDVGGSDALSSAPQFTTVELGHASDTTIARASAGNLTVEGNALYRAGGTDVAIADGGTGASTAAAAIAALGGIPATIFDAAGDIIVASAADTAARLAIGAVGSALARVNGAVAWNGGTAFPTAAAGDRFFRSDRGIEYYYTGAAWHSVDLYAMHMAPPPAAVTVTTSNYAGGGMFNGGDVYLVDYHYQYNVATTNDGTKYWAWTLQKLEAGTGTSGTNIVVPNSSAVAAGWNGGTTAINAAHTDVGALRVNADKTSTPGGFTGWFCVTYRLIG